MNETIDGVDQGERNFPKITLPVLVVLTVNNKTNRMSWINLGLLTRLQGVSMCYY